MRNDLLSILADGIERGLHLGAQVFVSIDRQPLIDLAIGETRIGVAMKNDTLNLWMSAVKPVAAVAIAQLVERRLVSFDDPVTKFIPEFGVNGKDAITIRHLLTHTGGFRLMPDAWLRESYDAIIARVCNMRIEPSWTPGEKAGYHPRSSWFVLGEIIHRIDGRMYDRYVREMVFEPLEMKNCWVGLPNGDYANYGDRIGAMFDTSQGSPRRDDVMLAVPSERSCANVFPGSNGRGPMRELTRFYEMLLNGGDLDGIRVISNESVAALTSPQRIGMYDHTFRQVIDWGFGFLLNNTRASTDDTLPYGYGDTASPSTFGHSGALSSCAFCDPKRKLVAAWVCNGMTSDAVHQVRQQLINNAIYEEAHDSE